MLKPSARTRTAARTAAPAHRLRRRPPFFRPVPLRARRYGWSAQRQCLFLAQLYRTGSVAAAARACGMSRMSAYRLRRRSGAESWARGWDRVLAGPGSGKVGQPKPDWRKVTLGELARRYAVGLLQPVLFRGVVVGIRRKADNSALLRLLRRCDGRSVHGGAEAAW